MKKIVLALTPDFVLSFCSFVNRLLIFLGLSDDPNKKEKNRIKREEEETKEKICEEIDSLFNMADENVIPVDDPWDFPDTSSLEEMESYIYDIDEELLGANEGKLCDMLEDGKKAHSIKCVRKITGWGLKESKLFIDNCAARWL